MQNVIVGIDYSSTNTGVCLLSEKGEYLCSMLLSPKDKKFDKRIVNIKQALFQILNPIANVLVIGIESPSFFSKGRTIDLASGYGFLKYSMIESGYDVLTFTPSTIKKFATNDGRADKDKMWKYLPKDVKEDLLASSYKKYDDLVDSYFIAKLAHSKIGV